MLFAKAVLSGCDEEEKEEISLASDKYSATTYKHMLLNLLCALQIDCVAKHVR